MPLYGAFLDLALNESRAEDALAATIRLAAQLKRTDYPKQVSSGMLDWEHAGTKTINACLSVRVLVGCPYLRTFCAGRLLRWWRRRQHRT